MTDDQADDISFTSTVRAQELRFNTEPHVEVALSGMGTNESTTVRSGFPKPVRAGVTYRRIRVDYRLIATSRRDASPE